jgi:hypothetical protein
VTRPRRARSLTEASRVRKARRDSTCPLCGGPIITGQQIGLIPAGWAHLSPCIVRRRKPTWSVTA